MQGCAEHLIGFPNKFNKLNNTRARMQDSIYNTTSALYSRPNIKIPPLVNMTLLWT